MEKSVSGLHELSEDRQFSPPELPVDARDVMSMIQMLSDSGFGLWILMMSLAHGDKFLSRTRMNANGGIKIGFGSSHFDGDRHPLDDFSGVFSHHMRS